MTVRVGINGFSRTYVRAALDRAEAAPNPASCVLDPALTQAHGNLGKVFGWYDGKGADL
ncbi:hypothetical protein [Streptomyces sp. NPDC058295]|uniref:hypothetical protein n=1 Tax=Streptomyces sp. NPDC058295 TaxID=3346431 RepID=UPI0036E33F8E